MNVTVPDDLVEKAVKEAVKARVGQFFAEKSKNDPFWLQRLCESCVKELVTGAVTPEVVNNACDGLVKANIADQVVERFSEKLRECFACDC